MGSSASNLEPQDSDVKRSMALLESSFIPILCQPTYASTTRSWIKAEDPNEVDRLSTFKPSQIGQPSERESRSCKAMDGAREDRLMAHTMLIPDSGRV